MRMILTRWNKEHPELQTTAEPGRVCSYILTMRTKEEPVRQIQTATDEITEQRLEEMRRTLK